MTGLARFSEEHWIGGWGTDVDEVFSDFEVFKRYTWYEVEEATGLGADVWRIGERQIESWVEGSVGWSQVNADVDLPSGREQLRITTIFHLERGDWKIVHLHWSFAAPEQLWGGESGRALKIMAAVAEAERPNLSEWMSVEGTTTLVFTDIEGSTALNALYGDRAWLDVLRAHNQVVRSATVEYGGTVVKSQGDGFMLAFGAATQALKCAVAIQRGVAETFRDPGSPIRVRIGVHTGEPLADGDDFFGHAVNYAARVAATAQPGEILVSALVHDIVGHGGFLSFDAPREVQMKGVAGTALVYPVAGEAIRGAGA